MAADGEVQKDEIIAISKFWEEELKSMPYLSCKYFILSFAHQMFIFIEKSGKTLHLLKQSSKKIQTGKKRKKIAILGTLQDWQDS